MKTIYLVLYLLVTTGCNIFMRPAKIDNFYAYSAGIIKNVDGNYYSFFCSTGGPGWDSIRYTVSSDLKYWSPAVIAITSSAYERASCDPSVVYFAGYYYIFYSGNVKDVQTVNFVARSSTITGPYLKYTQRNTWELNPIDPKVIQWPKIATADGPGANYGAGQPTVISKGDHLIMWYSDYTSGACIDYITTSYDGVTWSTPIATNLIGGSIEVKYDLKTNSFIAYQLANQHILDTYVFIQTSADGVVWTEPKVILTKDETPAWSNNIGVLSDQFGTLLDIQVITLGTPQDLNPNYTNDNGWGNWDLYSIDLQTKEYVQMIRTTRR